MLTFIIAGTTAVDDLLRSTIANFNHSLVSLSKSLEATGEICRLDDQKQLETPFFLPNNLVHWPTVSNVMMKLTLVDHHQVPYIWFFFERGCLVLISYKNSSAKYNAFNKKRPGRPAQCPGLQARGMHHHSIRSLRLFPAATVSRCGCAFCVLACYCSHSSRCRIPHRILGEYERGSGNSRTLSPLRI